MTTFDLLEEARDLWRLVPQPIRFAIVCGAVLVAAIVTDMSVLEVPVVATFWVAQQAIEKMVQILNYVLSVDIPVPQIL
ncbi:hypothetical protein [Rhodococcus sp. LW-XY12]|uniref:hypothetical protein n=1 Tax=Rhodococcus sp. LW-XY12 TaxID=2856851 RepID=UPI001C55FB71|nr:hypothetical protein [Rhodococcus sp. LW-XY12]QXU56352.1 hypothetical protein KXC42_24455 [Rhodococcus sp. LW-XY12]